jgi:hypothetical protein
LLLGGAMGEGKCHLFHSNFSKYNSICTMW